MPKTIEFLLGVIVVISFSGCATSYKSAATSPDYMSSSDYQERAPLEGSLFKSDQALLSDEDVRRILDGKLVLPGKARLTILLAGGSSLGVYDQIDEASLDALVASLSSIERISSVSFLPTLMVPDKVTIPHLREAAARFQSDLLLVGRVGDRSHTNYRMFRADEANAYGFAECILLDIRTGIVPFAASATEIVPVTKNKEDVDFYETREAAERQAAGKAALAVVDRLKAFLASVP